MSPPRPALLYAVAALLTLIWGTTWAVIRVGLEGIPPFTGVALRFTIAAAVLLAVGRAFGVRFGATPTERRLWLVQAAFAFGISYGVVYWAEQRVPSGLTSVLWATFPLFVGLLAHRMLPEERLTARALAGVVVGFGGVAVIFSEDFALLGGHDVLLASGVLLASPAVAAVSNVAVKKWGGSVHPVSLSAVPMGIAAALMAAAAAAVERGRPVRFDARSVGALLYLALMGSAVAFTLYYWLLARVRATVLSLITYLTPVVAVLVGAVFMDEPITPRTLAGSGLVVGGVGLATFARYRPKAPPEEP